MRSLLSLLLVLSSFSGPAWASPVPQPLDVHWDPGAEDCAARAHAPQEVFRYDQRTFILREDLCSTWEAPFVYLLVGDKQALLIDTGDVADPKLMPLADTVTGLLPGDKQAKLPLIVVHSHTHLDHRAGDPQFQGLANVHVLPAQLAEVRAYFGLSRWPEGMAQVDLGGRVVDVLPAPGHNPAHVVYYDRGTGLLFSGDFLMAARLLVDDIVSYRASARRIADFVRDRPVSYVLGGHVEEDSKGRLYAWQASHHPDEHALQLGKPQVLALPAALDAFNGFRAEQDGFVIINSMHELEAMAAAAALVLAALGYGIYRVVGYRRRKLVNRLVGPGDHD